MKKTLHLICNAHLDPVWLWQWEEGAAEVMSTFRTAADLCDEFDTFVFNHNEAVLYQWVEEYEPALFARIQRLVSEGRWHIMGGWFLQPDCNMPSGESFVRQILTGRRYFRDKFGVDPTTAINFDPFGHTRGLVQIMAKAGYDTYLFCRPGQKDCALPNYEFVWVGYDGSEIVGSRCLDWYNSPLGKVRAKIETRLANWPDPDVAYLLWGVGNHGGGPSRQDLRDIRDLIAGTTGVDLRHSTPEAYAADVNARRAQLPRLERDLNPWAVGCYTSQVRIKQTHRRLENELYAVEKMAAVAAAQGLAGYPATDLAAAERDLVFSEFHDILPGSSIQPVEEMSLRVMHHGLELLSRLKARLFFALAAGQPKAPEGEIPVLVHNPHPFPVTTVVECEFQMADQNWEPTFTDFVAHQNGRPLPSQIEKEDSNLSLDWRKRIAFQATLAPSSMNRFDCRAVSRPAKPVPALSPENGRYVVRSERLEVAVGTRTGLLESFRVDGAELLGPGACRPLAIADNADPWGMTVDRFRRVIGRFKLLPKARAAQISGLPGRDLPAVRVIEQGPVRTVIEAILGWGDSVVVLTYRIPHVGTEVEVSARVHWNEKDTMLKLALPVPAAGELVGQVAYGADTLAGDGQEAVAQQWLAVRLRAGAALTVINDGTYGCDFDGRELRLSLLRSPAYSGHPIGDRPIMPTDRYRPRIDQGERLFRFWLNGGETAARLAAIDREAATRNQPPMALSYFPAGLGESPAAGPVLEDDVVQLAAFKQAADGNGWIVRLFNPSPEPRSTALSLPWLDRRIPLSFGPWELATWRLDAAGELTPVNLLEDPR